MTGNDRRAHTRRGRRGRKLTVATYASQHPMDAALLAQLGLEIYT
ncbi:MAG: hypothetical protein QF570_06210 [Myxococcota bacterium]|jgi:hypothetical protein|nr:hypothetical protein [Myxococcota bacterium]